MPSKKKLKNIIICLLFAVVVLLSALTLAFLFAKNGENKVVFLDGIDGEFLDDDLGGVKISTSDISEKGLYEAALDSDLLLSDYEDTTEYDTENAIEGLESLGYTVRDEGENIAVYSEFYLKRLLVEGDYSDTYGATKIIREKLYDILCFDTEEDTSTAYEKLCIEGCNVTADQVVFVEDATIESTDTSAVTYSGDGSSSANTLYLSWGANAMDVKSYTEYLSTNGTDQNIAVVVIDTGINTRHELFTDRFFYDDDNLIFGKSYTQSEYYSGVNYTFEDDNGHGSHVSGIISNLTPDNVKIIPIKVFDSKGNGAESYVMDALQYVLDIADDYNIVCVNLSLSGSFNSEYYTKFVTLFNRLREKNILPVVAAGNDGKNTANYIPASCDNAIVVSALTMTYSSYGTSYTFDYTYSNYGNEVDFGAAGTYIYSAYKADLNINKYATLSGTSMATPHVSAAVALLCLDKYYWNGTTPIYTADAIENDLRNYALNSTSGKNVLLGYGMVSLSNYVNRSQYQITYVLENMEGVYGDEIDLSNGVYEVGADSGVDTSSVEITLRTTATNKSDVGEYVLTADVEKNVNNYSISIVDAVYKIVEREVTITVGNQRSMYGDDIQLDNTNYTVQNPENIIEGDDLDIVLGTSAKSTIVRSYEIHVMSNNPNYLVSYEIGMYTVSKRKILLSLSDEKIIYGDSVVLNNEMYEVVSGSIIKGDNLGVLLTTTATNNSGVGLYSIGLDKTKLNSNYEVNYNSGKLEITKRVLSATLENQGINFGDEFTFDDSLYTLSGGVIGNDELNITLSTSAKEGSGVGEYPIMLSYQNDNYAIEYDWATYTISPRKLTIKILDQTICAGNKISQTMYEITEGDLAGYTLDGLIITTDTDTFEDGQEYTLYGINSDKNFDITFINGTMYYTTDYSTIPSTSNIDDLGSGDDALDGDEGSSDENKTDTESKSNNSKLVLPIFIAGLTVAIGISAGIVFFAIKKKK